MDKTATRPDSSKMYPTGNGIRTGEQFLEGLRDDRDVWIHGRRVKDVTTEPGMARGVATLASFLDRQHRAEYQDKITYVDDDGIRCAMAHMIPRSVDDIRARGRAYYEWATWSNGMFGRMTNYTIRTEVGFVIAMAVIIQSMGGATQTVPKSRLKGQRRLRGSLMMSAAQQGLTEQDLADIVAYLKSL